MTPVGQVVFVIEHPAYTHWLHTLTNWRLITDQNSWLAALDPASLGLCFPSTQHSFMHVRDSNSAMFCDPCGARPCNYAARNSVEKGCSVFHARKPKLQHSYCGLLSPLSTLQTCSVHKNGLSKICDNSDLKAHAKPCLLLAPTKRTRLQMAEA